MTYNREDLLNMLSNAPIYEGLNFHEGMNDDFMACMNNDFGNNYDYAYGATKLALIPVSLDKDFVIKIPYTGAYSLEEYYYGYKNHKRKRDEYWEFYGGECEDRPWDYCAGEVQRYTVAAEEGFADCFAKTEFLGDINGYPVYIQEKCTTFSATRYKHKHSLEERRKTSKCCHNYSEIDENWLTDFRLYYGEAKLIRFILFLKKHQWDDDLRNENIGYIEDRPVLIDYSGFLD